MRRLRQRRASTGMALSNGFGLAPASPSHGSYGTLETYKKLDKLGEGTYATVFKGLSRVNGKLVALKEIRLEHEEGAPCTAIREVSLLKGLKHANIVTLHDIIHTTETLVLVFEYLEKDLKMYMDDCGDKIAPNNVRLFLFQLLRGVHYCHSRKVLHRDLKPQNLLINSAGELKLADFGLARAKSVPIKTYSHEVVTLWYRPPDVLLGSVDYSTPIDIWGCGCIFIEMVSGNPLFPGATIEDQIALIWKVLGEPTEESWAGVSKLPGFSPDTWPHEPPSGWTARVPRLDRQGLDLVNRMLQCNPLDRLSAQQAMVHPYFAGLGIPSTLGPTMSIFSCPGAVFVPDPLVKKAKAKASKRRQSVGF